MMADVSSELDKLLSVRLRDSGDVRKLFELCLKNQDAGTTMGSFVEARYRFGGESEGRPPCWGTCER